MFRRLAIPLLFLPQAIHAQAASYAYLNQRAPYSNPSPAMLTAQTLPKIGTALRLAVPYSWRQRNGVGADFVLATGLKKPDFPIAALGGFVFTSAEVLISTPMSPLGIPGTTTLNLSIPNDSRLLGVVFYQQILESTTSGKRTLSRGGQGQIGK